MKRILTTEEAKALLPDKEYIHTFRSSVPNVLIGADWRKQDVLDAIGVCQCELAGAAAKGVDHGLCIHVDGPLFVETRPFDESTELQPVNAEAAA